MTYHVDLQNASETLLPIDEQRLISWAILPLSTHKKAAELTMRFVTEKEITRLNHDYRHQNKATNVLAFKSNLPININLKLPLLGDLIICPLVLQRESKEQNKTLEQHWAHIVIHGVLHLLGFDHVNGHDAKIMQDQEIKFLAVLGFSNPY